ncbi:MAG: DNA/RNA nuclease SfsA [Ruminococcaceae bacterium]|nr:DNA/RNA nuclease SfsA [Oscillospiraceae bacterium]
MLYKNTVNALFKKRLNRFTALAEINGREETVHVKNTGRMKELLFEGARVILSVSDNPHRKTAYDLVGVYKEGLGLINIDSQAPNKVMYEWLKSKDYDLIKPEYRYGNSRFDFYLEKGNDKYFIEVKGCTLEIDGIGYFPDAPTERGVKHLYELVKASEQGYRSAVAFVIQMPQITEVRANIATHKEFGDALDHARSKGVEVMMLQCEITDNDMKIIS